MYLAELFNTSKSLRWNIYKNEVYGPIYEKDESKYDIDEFLQSLNESILVSSPSSDAVHEYYDFYSEELSRMVYQYKNSNKDRMPWEVVPAAKLTAIWHRAAKEGFVRDVKGLDKIADMFYTNIIKLNINTDIAEHNSMTKEEILGEYFDDDDMEAFVDWCIETDTGWRITDVGFPRLSNLACLLHDSNTSEDKLLVCDAIMNIAHQRSDMASWFVEGGSSTLSYISSPK